LVSLFGLKPRTSVRQRAYKLSLRKQRDE